MGTKKNKGSSDDAFGDLEDSFFASGEDDTFWDDEVVNAYEDSMAIPKKELERLKAEMEAQDLAQQAAAEALAAEAVEAAPVEAAPPAIGDLPPPSLGGHTLIREPDAPPVIPAGSEDAAAEDAADSALLSSPTADLPAEAAAEADGAGPQLAGRMMRSALGLLASTRWMRNSTRRLKKRPWSVALLSMGRLSP